MTPSVRCCLVVAVVNVAAALCNGAASAETLLVTYNRLNTAAKTCAESLRENFPRLGYPGFEIVLDGSGKSPNDQPSIHIKLESDGYPRAVDIASVPFVFRDPAHVLAFLDSDLYKELRHVDLYSHNTPWVAMAYGSFYQLFSANNALTEPQHFYMQWIGGGAHAQLYTRFKAIPGTGAILSGIFADDIDIMARNTKMMAAVEIPMIEASRYKLSSHAKFLNLTSSALYPVLFVVERNVSRYRDMGRITRWAEASAQTCSAKNFEAEKAEIDGLKRAGVTIVPVNRGPYVEAGWLWSMTRVNSWSIEDLDRMVRIGDGRPERRPSEIVAMLAPKDRETFSENSQAVATLRTNVLANIPVAREFDTDQSAILQREGNLGLPNSAERGKSGKNATAVPDAEQLQKRADEAIERLKPGEHKFLDEAPASRTQDGFCAALDGVIAAASVDFRTVVGPRDYSLNSARISMPGSGKCDVVLMSYTCSTSFKRRELADKQIASLTQNVRKCLPKAKMERSKSFDNFPRIEFENKNSYVGIEIRDDRALGNGYEVTLSVNRQ